MLLIVGLGPVLGRGTTHDKNSTKDREQKNNNLFHFITSFSDSKLFNDYSIHHPMAKVNGTLVLPALDFGPIKTTSSIYVVELFNVLKRLV